jgi:hypothetical protein
MLNDLKELLGRDPFSPFRIVVTSGNAYAVTSPFQVALGASQLNYCYPKSDRWAVLRLNQVVAYEVEPDSKMPRRRRGSKG